jgi:hypothetical protein
MVDVYQGAQTVMLMISPYSSSSLQYAAAAVRAVPNSVSIVLLLNFWDKVAIDRKVANGQSNGQSNGRTDVSVTTDDVAALAQQITDSDRAQGCDRVTRCIACSMLDCFGLRVSATQCFSSDCNYSYCNYMDCAVLLCTDVAVSSVCICMRSQL